MSTNYDIIIIGSGPGGYVAAIRASQLGMKVGVVERAELGGICLNWGCIPTKALLKSAQVFDYIQHATDYGITVKDPMADFTQMITRSRKVAGNMSKGIQFLFKKNKIDILKGSGMLKKGNKVSVKTAQGEVKTYAAKHIIVATGGRSKQLPTMQIDGKKIIGYREAMVLEKQPKKMVVVGSGAIGVEFAYFYQTIGTEVTVIEYMDTLVPVEDKDISKQLERTFAKSGVQVMTSSEVLEVNTQGKGCKVTIKTPKGKEVISCDVVLSAIGIETNIENIGLEEAGVKIEKGKVRVDEFYRTNIEGIYAIGDVVKGQALAHVASAEGITCVEKIQGFSVEPINYNNIPGCTYCIPEIASVGYTEAAAKKAGYDIKVGKFPFSASGKAQASGAADGFVKVIFDAKYGEWLGAHMIGNNVTEMIAEVVAARKLETTGHEVLKTVHPHPTMSEAVMEATADAYDEAIHL